MKAGRMAAVVLMVVAGCWQGTRAEGEPAQAQPAIDRNAAVTLARTLGESLEKLDAEGVVSHLTDDVVVVPQDGTALEGKARVMAYLAEAKAGKGWFLGVSTKPEVKTVGPAGDAAVVSGLMHDKYVLMDHSEMAFDSRFTATLVRQGGAIKVSQMQIAPGAFDNPMMKAVVNKSANALVWVWVMGAAIGAVIGGLVVRKWMKKAR